MKRTRCFFLSGVSQWKVYLRRYVCGIKPETICNSPSDWGYHNKAVEIGQIDSLDKLSLPDPERNDPRWPKECDCGYVFKEDDIWQVNREQLLRRMDTGELVTLQTAPPGAMWHADWMIDGVDADKVGNMWKGPDGHCLMVRLPNGHEWMVDGRCSNCTMPTDNIHKCWPRHGEVPDITVDKNGNTCKAGAGSVAVPAIGKQPAWHGFLRNGWLEEC